MGFRIARSTDTILTTQYERHQGQERKPSLLANKEVTCKEITSKDETFNLCSQKKNASKTRSGHLPPEVKRFMQMRFVEDLRPV